MLKQPILYTCLLALAFGLISCEGSGPSGPGRPYIVVIPSTNSEFVYDCEQKIVPVKPEDNDAMYRFELTARIDNHDIPEQGLNDIISVRLYDSLGFEIPHLRYKLNFNNEGNILYNEPYTSNTWTTLAFATGEDITGPDTAFGNPDVYYQEVHQKTTYLGTEQITVGNELLECDKIEWTRMLTEVDEYSPSMGTLEERHVFWFAKKLGFFVQRESDITSLRLHKPKWKYSTKERLKRYSITF